MVTFTREMLKDPKFPELQYLLQFLVSNHKAANHTEEVLIKNRHIKNFCEIGVYYAVMDTDNVEPVYMCYETWSWFKEPNGLQVSIRSVTVYDNKNEYEIERHKGLHDSKFKSEGGNLN